jgi:hypothetical protein
MLVNFFLIYINYIIRLRYYIRGEGKGIGRKGYILLT